MWYLCQMRRGEFIVSCCIIWQSQCTMIARAAVAGGGGRLVWIYSWDKPLLLCRILILELKDVSGYGSTDDAFVRVVMTREETFDVAVRWKGEKDIIASRTQKYLLCHKMSSFRKSNVSE
mmetsp:Transcript_6324/g.8378  ORF Transcript_6324/g.8378 Transcript_6324/m.8378 type:complete len:120 (+) Transcript_6324:59-418(+)